MGQLKHKFSIKLRLDKIDLICQKQFVIYLPLQFDFAIVSSKMVTGGREMKKTGKRIISAYYDHN